MTRNGPRIAIARLRHAAFFAFALALGGSAIEATMLYAARSEQIISEDRSGEFSFGEPARTGPDTSPSAIETILAKPLFAQGRGAVSAIVAVVAPLPPTPEPVPEAEIRLVGIQLSERSRLAIIQLSGSEGFIRAVEGQPVAGWVVEHILHDHVELTKEARSRSVYLSDTKPSKDEETVNP